MRLKKTLSARVDAVEALEPEMISALIEVADKPPISDSTIALLRSLFKMNEVLTHQKDIEKEHQHIDELPQLRELTPLIYEILSIAYENRMKQGKGLMPRSELVAEAEARLKAVNKGRRGMYMAYKHAANLTSPHYTYNGRRRNDPVSPTKLPTRPIYSLPFCNQDLKKVIYATCRFHGIGESKLKNLDELADLLVHLGFTDENRDDYVSSFMTLITGESIDREKLGPKYRHFE